MIVNAGGGGLGPTIIPNVKGRTVTTNLMRDAIATQPKYMKRKGGEVFSTLNLSPKE